MIKLEELCPKGRTIKRVLTGSELLFLNELNKYSKLMLGKALDIRGVQIPKQIKEQELYSYVVREGLLKEEEVELKEYSSIMDRLFTGTVEGVVFKKDSEKEVHYEYAKAPRQNLKLNESSRESAYVSLVAYIWVRSYKEGKEIPKVIIGEETHLILELEYHHLYILSKEGNKILEDYVEYRGRNEKVQVEWEGYVMLQRQKGLMRKKYTNQEKLEYIRRKGYKEGDVFLLYKRVKCTKSNTISVLESCYPCVIESITREDIKIRYYTTIETELTRHMKLMLIEEGEEDTLISHDDYARFVECTEVYPWINIGVEGCTYDEQVFILSPMEDDGSYQWLAYEGGQEYVWLNTLETIYAVFEDRGVKYNKELYLDKYFRSVNKKPIYEQYRERR